MEIASESARLKKVCHFPGYVDVEPTTNQTERNDRGSKAWNKVCLVSDFIDLVRNSRDKPQRPKFSKQCLK